MTPEALAIDGGQLAVSPPDDRGVHAFKGIPYARAPVGPLRWRPPEPPMAWPGVRRSDRFGPNSVQGIVFDDIDPRPAGISEDCLYLNVWTPDLAPETPAAVMFWIHGGGFVVGSGAEPRYDGTNLAARGIVVVTVNHRLNALGFLAHPELTAEAPKRFSGNYGLLDLVAALGWVRRNIRAFGGDPGRVTIAGESAGSRAVSALMAAPSARDLFAGVIGESGAHFPLPLRALPTLAEAEDGGLAFMRRAGAASLAELRALPAEAILAAAPGIGFEPIVDGHVLPEAPAAAFAAGRQADVPLLAGWNRDEGYNFTVMNGPGADGYAARVTGIFGDRAGEALTLYPGGGPEADAAAARELGGDLVIDHPTWAWLEAHRETARSEVFRFCFARAPLVPDPSGGFSQRAGAFHAAEIVYVFETLGAVPWRMVEDDRRASALVAGYWVNFVRSGDPNGPGLPPWPSYRRGDDPVMILDAIPRVAPDGRRERHLFLAAVAQAREAKGG